MQCEETAKNAAGWEVCLANLEGLAGEESPQTEWSELHEHYAERFGVDPEVGRRAMREYSDRPGDGRPMRHRS